MLIHKIFSTSRAQIYSQWSVDNLQTLILSLCTGKYLLKSTISVRRNDAGKLLRGEKASADHELPGRGGGKGAITQVDENAVLARTRSRELWVSHIFADVRTTKSFSLAALFSTRKSCSVTALVRTKQPWLLRTEQKDAFSVLPFSRKLCRYMRAG
jgi:hypothetical protein